MKCMHVWAAQKAYYLFTKLLIKPHFPSLVDEIAEPCLDMNIKVATKSIYMDFEEDFSQKSDV